MQLNVQRKVADAIEYEASRSTYPEGFPGFPEIPGGRYTSKAFYELEMTHLWRKSWLCAGREEEVPTPRSYKLFEKVGAAVIILRGNDGQIRAFHNTCRHRGAPIVRAPKGQANVLVCGYHCWSYDLTGKLVGVPEEEDFCGLDKSTRGLLPVRCESWDGWLFVNFDMEARPLVEHLGQIYDDVRPMRMEKLGLKRSRSYAVQCNWKAAMDAFLEAYHVRSIHPKTVGTLLDPKATAIALFSGGSSRMAMRKTKNQAGGTWGGDNPIPDIPGVPDIFRANNLAYGVFPNIAAPFDSGGFPFLIFWPTGLNTTEVEFVSVGWNDEDGQDSTQYWDTFMENYDAISMEDFQFLAGIQKSLESGAFTGMVLNYQERRIYWAHEEIDRRIGVERIPENLRVKPVLGAYVES